VELGLWSESSTAGMWSNRHELQHWLEPNRQPFSNLTDKNRTVNSNCLWNSEISKTVGASDDAIIDMRSMGDSGERDQLILTRVKSLCNPKKWYSQIRTCNVHRIFVSFWLSFAFVGLVSEALASGLGWAGFNSVLRPDLEGASYRVLQNLCIVQRV